MEMTFIGGDDLTECADGSISASLRDGILAHLMRYHLGHCGFLRHEFCMLCREQPPETKSDAYLVVPHDDRAIVIDPFVLHFLQMHSYCLPPWVEEAILALWHSRECALCREGRCLFRRELCYRYGVLVTHVDTDRICAMIGPEPVPDLQGVLELWCRRKVELIAGHEADVSSELEHWHAMALTEDVIVAGISTSSGHLIGLRQAYD